MSEYLDVSEYSILSQSYVYFLKLSEYCMYHNILTTLCARIFRIYKTFQLSDNMSNIFELSDNLKKLCMERIQFDVSIGKKSKMYVLYKK